MQSNNLYMIKDMKRQKDIQSFDFSMIGEERQIILDTPNNGCACESNECHLADSKDDISVDCTEHEFIFLDSIKESLDFDFAKEDLKISSLNYLRMANDNMKTIDKMKLRILRNRKDDKQTYQILSMMIKWLLSIIKYLEMSISINSDHKLNHSLNNVVLSIKNAILKIESKKDEINCIKEV